MHNAALRCNESTTYHAHHFRRCIWFPAPLSLRLVSRLQSAPGYTARWLQTALSCRLETVVGSKGTLLHRVGGGFQSRLSRRGDARVIADCPTGRGV